MSKKKWFSVTKHVDIETGEMLTKSAVERLRYVKVGREEQVDYSNSSYNLKSILYHYESSKQTRLFD